MLDKKALRRFAADNPAPAIPMGHGLLHASQVDYIIRTAVRIIDHRRTLVLYIFDRARAVDGDTTPVWTMFQADEDYITLARREDGSTHWREAAFERLGKSFYFTGKCAFYSVQDGKRVCGFFHDGNHDGIAALLRAQRDILDGRSQERQRKREKQIIDRMRTLHALPRGLNGWVRREVMPAYFRCEHTSARKPVTGVCTSCGKESTLPNAAHNAKIACPHCKRELTVKSVGKMGCHFDRDTVQVIERFNSDEVVTRIVKVWYSYDRDHLMPKMGLYENARVFVCRDPDGKAVIEPYYYSYSGGTLTPWKRGERPVFSHYQYNFEADTCGHVYCRNLPEALVGTPWEYCPTMAFYGHFRERMQLAPFLTAHIEHPRFEHLIKVGFFDLASDLAYREPGSVTLDETQNRTHRILRVAPEDVAFLRDLQVGLSTLRAFQKHSQENLKNRQELFLWTKKNGVVRDVDHILEHATVRKLLRYVDRQYAALRHDGGKGRYGNMQAAVSEYRDYLGMCVKLGYDMSNGFVLYPKNLQEAHDRAQGRLKAEANARMRRDFKAAMEAIYDHLDYEADGMKLILPSTPEELAAEGNALHHCVGGYADRVAKHECVILFLRQCEDADKPFFTVEVRNKKVVQVRGMGNCAPTPEVAKFMDKWERQVLRAA